jgi:fibronectin-binding autotransporter adhesin
MKTLIQSFTKTENKKLFKLIGLIFFLFLTLGNLKLIAQQTVFWRDNAANGNWENGGCGDMGTNPSQWWYPGFSPNQARNRPDCNDGSTTRHNVNIDNNHQTTMTTNTTFWGLRSLTLANTATSNRTINSSPDDNTRGISFTNGLFNNGNSGVTHTFNTRIGIDFSTVTLRTLTSGATTTFNREIFGNANNIIFDGAGATNATAVISGTGASITKNDAGTLTFSGASANTFTGATTVNGGTLVLNKSANVIAIPAALTANNAVTVRTDAANQWGTGTPPLVTLNGTSTLNLNNNNQRIALAGVSGTFVTLGSATLDINNTGTDTYAGVISGTGGVTKTNTGMQILSGTNTYTGATAINAGVLRLQNLSGLGTTAGATTVSSGAALEFSGAFSPVSENITINGTGISNGGALRNITNNTRILDGSITLGSDARINSDQATLNITTTNLNSHTLYAGGNGTVQLNTALSNGGKTTGDGAIFKDGSGELRLMGNFTALTGTVNLTQGTIRINNNNGLGNSGLLVMSNGTTLRPDDTTTRNTPKNVSVLGNITLGYVNQGLTISGNVDLNAGTRQITSIFGNTISGVISNGALTKTGAGPLILSGNNTYTGNTLISEGVLNANAVGSLGVGSDVFIASGTILNVNANVEVGSAREAGFSNSGVIAISAGNTLTSIGANKGSYFQNSISGAGGLTMAGSGTTNMNLFGTQSYTGATTVSGGQLTSTVAMSTSSLTVTGGTFSAGAASILGNTIPVTVNGGTYQLGGIQTIGSLAGSGGTVNMGASTLTTGNDNTNTSYSGVISGTGGLTKIGTGAFTLDGTVNTYTGNTTVNNGTLTVGATNVINAASNLVLTSGTFNLASGFNLTLNSANMTGGAITRAGDNSLTLNNSSSFTGGTITYSSTGSIIANGTTTLGNVTFNSTSTSATTHNTLRLGGDIIVNNNTTANFTNTGGSAGVRFNLGDANRTINVGTNAILNIDWRINSTTPASGGIIKTGAGRLTITHPLTVYTGPTTISAGELRLNPSNTSASWTSPMTLNGGTLSTDGIAAGTNITNATAVVTLNLNASSAINLASVSHSITFANSSAVTWNGIELTIFGWTGTAGSSGTNGRIFFGNNSGGLTSDQLSKITFDGYASSAILLNTGELVPANSSLYFRTVSSGDWATPATWEAADNPSFTSPFSPTYTPNNSNSLLIQIRNGHNVTISNNTVADDLVIDAGGILTHNTGTLTINNGAAATDFLINGTFNANAPLTINPGTGVTNNNIWQTSTSTLINAGSSITQAGTAVYNHAANGGTIPISTWNAGALLRITGITNSSTIGGMGQTFHHIEYDCPSQTSTSVQLQGEINGINGNFTMVSTGGTGREFRFFTNATNTNTSLTVQGDFIMTGGKIAVTNSSSSGSANPTLNINGNLNISGSAIFDLTGNSTNTAAGSTVNLLGDLSITGSGTIVRTQNTPSTFRFNRASDIQNFNSHATGISAGQINWQAGNGTTQPVLVLASDFIMQAAATLTVNNAATIEFGTFIARGTTAGTNGSFTLNSGATLRTGNVNGIVAELNATTGSVQTGTAKTFNAGANYTYNGAANQVTGTGLPLTHTGVLTINNPGNTVSLTATGSTGFNVQLVAGNFAIGSAQTYNISNNGSVNSTGGDIASGTTGGTINFNDAGSFTGNMNPYNVFTSGGVNFGTGTVTIQDGGVFRINAGGFVNTNAPFYAVGSTLNYNSASDPYGRNLEWRAASGRGFPHHVLVTGSTTINPGANGNTGQVLNTGGNVTIESGSNIYMDFGGNNMTVPMIIGGNLNLIGNLSGSELAGGDVRIRGNWVNNGTAANYFPNGRAVFFDGSSVQDIGGTNTAVNPFAFLLIENNSGVTLSANQQVNNQLTFTNGTITLNNSNFRMNGSSTISGANASRYFITNGTGLLYRNFANVNTLFPVGSNASSYNPLTLNQTGTVDNIGVRVVETPAYSNAVNNNDEMVLVEYFLSEDTPGGNSLFTGIQWNAANEAVDFIRTNPVYHGNWTGTNWVVRSTNATTGTNPYVSNSIAFLTGTLSNSPLIIGNINGILACVPSVANGNWNDPATWGGFVPPTEASVCINHDVVVTGTDANISNVTLNPTGDLDVNTGRTLTLSDFAVILNSSGSATNLGAGTIIFSGVGAVSGTNGVTINNLTLSGNTTLTAATTIEGNLTLNTGSFIITGSPIYTPTSTLIYNNSGSYNVSNEWTGNATSPGSGIPQNVTIQNGTTVNMPNANRGLAGNLNISSGGLSLNATSGDLYIAGNWERNNTGTTFTPNNRAVFFNGAANQTITRTGGGTESFAYLRNDKPSNNLILNSSPATNVNITASSGNVLSLITTSGLDLNGQTINLTGTAGNINLVAGPVSIIGGLNSVLAINNGTKTIVTSTGGSLVTGGDVTLALSNGINFGSGLSTIQGTLQIAAGGFVTGNAPFYATGSLLRYFTGGNYDRGLEWSALTGAGYPHHVTIDLNGTATTLNLLGTGSAVRRIAGNLTINNGGNLNMNTMTNRLEVLGNVTIGGTTSGSLILSSNAGGDIAISGDLTRNAGGTFTQNNREVEMNGSSIQQINGVTTFGNLAINNNGGVGAYVRINSNTTINNRLRLTNGLYDLNGFDNIMANNAEIMRTSSTATMNDEPIVSGSDIYDVRYTATMTTDNEFSSNIEAVRDLIIGSGATPVLNANRTFNRNMNLEGGNFDLSTYTLTARGRATAPAFSGSISVSGGGTRTITGSAGSQFDITGLGGNNPTDYTKTVSTFGGTLLSFDSEVLVRVGDGSVDFGAGNPTTVNGILQILLGGSVGQILNPCYYGVNSILRFANTVDYLVGPFDKTWAAGAISSGLPGIPYNVEVFDTGTELRLEDNRALRGNLTITNGTFTLNYIGSGTFNIGGNWTRTGASSSFTHNDKRVIFDGLLSGSQFITVGSGVSAETFYDLDIAAATGNITLGSNTDIVVLNNLNFVSNKLDMNTTGNTISVGTATTNGSITGFDNNKYVISNNGEIIIYTNSNAVYTYPFGDASNYTPFELTLNAGAQTGAFITGKMTLETHPNIDVLNTFQYIERYWDIVPTGLSTSPAPDYDVKYNYAAIDEVGSNLTYRPVKYSYTNTNPGWIASPGGPAGFIEGSNASHNTSTREFIWEGISTFSSFTGAGDGSPLPISLINFNAEPVNQHVLVTWTTASEVNNDYFQIERSQDAVNYQVVGIIDGAGNSNQVLEYQLIDKNPHMGVSYYRLRQVDFNGSFEVFEPVAVNFRGALGNIINVYPNPANEITTIQINTNENDRGVLQIFSVSGALVWQTAINTIDGVNAYKLDVKDLKAGQYIITVRMNKSIVKNVPLIITR